jgi:hypothetical protein
MIPISIYKIDRLITCSPILLFVTIESTRRSRQNIVELSVLTLKFWFASDIKAGISCTWTEEFSSILYIRTEIASNEDRYRYPLGRSQWLRGLKHEQSSPARTMGSWVRIAHEAWMSVCAFILCLCCSVCKQQPYDGLITRPRSFIDCIYRSRNWESGQGPQGL